MVILAMVISVLTLCIRSCSSFNRPVFSGLYFYFI